MMKRYQVIYADPPWRYDYPISNSRRVENHYPTMDLDSIKALTIPSADDAVLFLWTTAPLMPSALDVMVTWGFTYHTCAVWDKEHIGMGFWFRNQHEILLVGVCGKFSPPPVELRMSSVFRAPPTEHSVKPNGIRQRIAEWYPNATKLEMFARTAEDGWDTWGNEAPPDKQCTIVYKGATP